MNYKKAENQIQKIVSNSDKILEDVVNFLHDNFDHYSWVGIYIIEGDHLVLGPWKGPNVTEHTCISIGEGVCGSAASTGITEIINDVKEDKRYLACFVSTKSEIVVPIKKEGRVVGEIDIDSDKIGAFTLEDKIFLERVADFLQVFFVNF